MSLEDLCPLLLAFRQLLSEGHDPESAFLLTHQPNDGPCHHQQVANQAIDLAATMNDNIGAYLARSDATLGEMAALVQQAKAILATAAAPSHERRIKARS